MNPPSTAADSGNCRWPVAGRECDLSGVLSLIKKTRTAVGAVGNGPPFSKARWARLRVHGAGSVHGLFGATIDGVTAWPWPNRSSLKSSAETIVDPEASCAVNFVTRRPPLGWWRLSPPLGLLGPKLGTSNSSSTE